MEIEGLHKQGLPPREHSADIPEHATGASTWIAGAIAMLAVAGLVLFGTSRTHDTIASSPNLNTERGTTTGSAPASPSKPAQ